MALTMFWRCQSTTLDGTHDFSAGDTEAAAHNSPELDAAAGLVDGNGILISGANENYRFDNASIMSAAEGSVGFHIRWQTFNAGGASWFHSLGSHFNNHIKLIGASTNELRLVIRDETAGESLLSSTDADIAVDTTYWVDFSWDDTNNLRRIRVFDSSGNPVGSSPWTSSDAFTGPANLTHTSGLRIGEVDGIGTPAFYIDNLFIGNAYADAETFFTNRNITSHTDYASGGGGGPSIAALFYHLTRQGNG